MEERNRRVDDAEYRREQNLRFIQQAQQREVMDFYSIYQHTQESAHLNPQFLGSPAGAYVQLPVNVNMQSSQAVILNAFNNLFAADGAGGLAPINTPFDWPRNGAIYAYLPPYRMSFAEEFDVIDRPRYRSS